MSALYFALSTKKSGNVSSKMVAKQESSKAQLSQANFYRNLLVKKCQKWDQENDHKIG